jgi:hypothetical protein
METTKTNNNDMVDHTTNHPRRTQLWRGSSGGTTDVIEGKLPEEEDTRNLMAGAIANISALRVSQHNTNAFQPIVQVLRSTKHEYCYELIVSDGSDSTTVYLDRPCEDNFPDNCLLRLVRFKHLPRLHEDNKYICIFEYDQMGMWEPEDVEKEGDKEATENGANPNPNKRMNPPLKNYLKHLKASLRHFLALPHPRGSYYSFGRKSGDHVLVCGLS